ncbi:hypothetical protein [Aquimarina sp. 2201CG14-23]|uniref:hypothetical protein n=1 Tax=Aquimarina mycalae TaxID=3040073 RepID=UPI0024780467|nr:hypothetical protein [Aquimarina sp. 2201CG14-23]MDH7447628.1 hypothetical protein [Aquimarina sp. 2201CG14-23]
MISTTEITEELKSHPILRHAPSLLKRWKGNQARLFNLSENHRKIQLRISEDRYQNDISCLLISMHEPITMKGSFDWDNADIEIEYHDTYYKVVDAENHFEITCNNVSITEGK